MQTNLHPAEEELMAYLDGEGLSRRAAVIAEHLANCEQCTQLSASWGKVADQLRAWQVDAPNFALRADSSNAPRESRRRAIWEFIHNRQFVFAGLPALAILALVLGDLWLHSKAPQPVLPDEHEFAVGSSYSLREQSRALKSIALEPTATMRSKVPALSATARTTASAMIARVAHLSLTAINLDETRVAIDALIARHHGYTGQISYSSPADGARNLTATLHIPAAELEAALADCKTFGHVDNETLSGDDVTPEFVDTEARLGNARITESRLQELLRQQSGKMSDVLEVEQELSRVRGEIELMETQRKSLSTRVAFGTIELVVQEKHKASINDNAPDAMLRLRNAAVEGYRQMIDTVLGLIAFLLSILPTLIMMAGVLFFPARFAWRRRRRSTS